MVDLQQLKADTKKAMEGLLEVAKLEAGQVFVVGCSTSEVAGERIGTSGSLEIAQVLINQIMTSLRERNIYLAVVNLP